MNQLIRTLFASATAALLLASPLSAEGIDPTRFPAAIKGRWVFPQYHHGNTFVVRDIQLTPERRISAKGSWYDLPWSVYIHRACIRDDVLVTGRYRLDTAEKIDQVTLTWASTGVQGCGNLTRVFAVTLDGNILRLAGKTADGGTTWEAETTLAPQP